MNDASSFTFVHSLLPRYPNLNVSSVTPIQVRSLLDTDDPDSVKQPPVQSDIDIPKKRRRRGKFKFVDGIN